MRNEDAIRKILSTLNADLRLRHGQIAKIESEIGRSPGYLNKVTRSTWSMPLDVLLRTLEACEIEPGTFFGRAFDIASTPEDYLQELAVRENQDGIQALRTDWEIVRQAAMTNGSPSRPLTEEQVAARVAELTSQSPKDQRRQLRTRRGDAHPAVVAAYIAHLDVLREGRPDEAVQLASTLIREVVPRLGGDDRRVLGCRALAVLGSAYRSMPRLGAAAAALVEALAWERLFSLGRLRWQILLRAAAVLSDADLPRRAQDVLRWALEAALDHDGGTRAQGQVLTSRGIVHGYAGDYREAQNILSRAIRLLPPGHSKEAAYHHLMLAATAAGDAENAERWLARALGELNRSGRSGARLAWQRGRILLVRGRAEAAMRSLRKAMDLYEAVRDAEGALVVPDLLRAARPGQLHRLAQTHVRLLLAYRGRSAEALGRLAEASLNEELTPGLVEEVAAEVQRYPLQPSREDVNDF